MKRIVITGAHGRIGSVLREGLSEYDIPTHGMYIDSHNLRTGRELVVDFRGATAIIHLAWIRVMAPPVPESSYLDELPTDNRSLENLRLSYNVLEAAAAAGVSRIILASSVHVDNFYRWPGPGFLHPDRVPSPTGPYGASKLLLEELGRYWSTRGLEVICVRLGGITLDDAPDPDDRWERRVWLSHRDCVALMKSCIEADSVPGNFSVFYGVSNNVNRVHDTSNPFGWQARSGDGATAGDIRKISVSPEQEAYARKLAVEHNQGFADRALALLLGLADTCSPRGISRYEHCLQVATRALRDGADEETIVSALFHDVFSYFTTENHATVAAEMLRPYVSQKNYWTVKMHGEFLFHHGGHFPESQCNAREKFRDHPWFDRTVKFCDQWDFPSDDPSYDTLPLKVFEPMVRRIFARTPYAHVNDNA